MFKLVSKYLKNYIFYILLAFILIIAQTFVQIVLLMGQMKTILDQGVAMQDMDFIYKSGLVMLLYTLLIGLLTVVISYLTSKISGIFLCRMRKDCYIKTLSMTPEMFDHFGSSTLTTRTMDDPKAVANLMQFLIGRVVMIPIVIVFVLFVVFSKSKVIFSILFSATIIAAIILILLEFMARKSFRIYQSKIDRLNQLVKEKILGVRSIRSFRNEDLEEEKGIQHNKDIVDSAIKANQPMKFMNPVTMIIFNWVMVLIYYVGTSEIKSNIASISDLIMIFQYLGYFTMALSLIPTLVNMLPKAQVSSERILELLNYGHDSSSKTVDKSLKPNNGSLELKHVTFGYEKDRPVLKDISFKIDDGSTLGIVGTTGSGKSTLLMLLMGFYEINDGDILIDGISINDLDKSELSNQFSYSPQKAYVFQDTVKNNITAFNENISKDEILTACRISRFDEVLGGLSEGLDTMMSQGGMNLSGGQRKRLALARAVAKKSNIYILDDPYAALDAITEGVVSANISNALKSKTKIIVSSKIVSIKDADNILVLEKGEMVGFGKHEELLKNCKEYKEIYDTQCYLDRED